MLKNVKLIKGMSRDEVNALLKDNGVNLELVDDEYDGVFFKHKWKCECSNEYINTWDKIKFRNLEKCKKCRKVSKYSFINSQQIDENNYENIKSLNIEIGMNSTNVNKIIGEFIKLNDDIYLGVHHNHNWICKYCGNVFKRNYANIKHLSRLDCGCLKYNEEEKRYKREVEKDGEYEYLKSFRNGDVLPNSKILKGTPHIQVKHKYCGSVYTVNASGFINQGQRCGQCCQKYENSFAHFVEVELGESLDKYWDFDNNVVNPYFIYRNYEKSKVWIKCVNEEVNEFAGLKKKEYHDRYEILCSDFISNKRCPYCVSKKLHQYDSFAAYHIQNTDKYFINKYWSNKNTISPWEISPSSKKNIILKCQNKDYHGEYVIYASDFTTASKKNNNGCTYCHGHKKVHKLDSLGNLRPDIAKMICDDVDVYSITPYSHKTFNIKCSRCGKIQSKKIGIDKLSSHQGFSCEYCSDGISIPEKFVSNILNILKIEFKKQNVFEWSRNIYNYNYKLQDTKIYDIFIENYNLIIEIHGRQHYEDCSFTSRSLEEEQENDRIKKELALGNGISNYIVIDCRESTLEWLKENVIKELSPYFDIPNIDWNKVWEDSQNSLCVNAWELWNSGESIEYISKKLKLSTTTIRTYLNKGKDIGKCSYDGKLTKRKYHNNYKIKIIRLDNSYEIYQSMSELCDKLGISRWFYDKYIETNNHIINKKYFCNHQSFNMISNYDGCKVEFL